MRAGGQEGVVEGARNKVAAHVYTCRIECTQAEGRLWAAGRRSDCAGKHLRGGIGGMAGRRWGGETWACSSSPVSCCLHLVWWHGKATTKYMVLLLQAGREGRLAAAVAEFAWARRRGRLGSRHGAPVDLVAVQRAAG